MSGVQAGEGQGRWQSLEESFLLVLARQEKIEWVGRGPSYIVLRLSGASRRELVKFSSHHQGLRPLLPAAPDKAHSWGLCV